MQENAEQEAVGTSPDPKDGRAAADSPAQGNRSGRKIGRTLLFFAGSAIFGGLAVAFWERKTLAEIRRREAEGVGEEADF